MPDRHRTRPALTFTALAATSLALCLAFGPAPAQAEVSSDPGDDALWDGGDKAPPRGRLKDSDEGGEEASEGHTARRQPTSRRAGTGTYRPKRSIHSDLTSNWFHVGGGGGGIVPDLLDPQVNRAGRFVVGGGGYTFFAYGGGELSITGRAGDPLSLTAAGFTGLAIPIPVVHPLIGIRGGAGHHLVDGSMHPHVAVGPQVGLIVRQFDGRPGVRVMADVGVEYRIEEQSLLPEVFVTVSAVF